MDTQAAKKMPALEDGEILTPINDGIRLIERKDGLAFSTDALLLASFVRRRPDYIAADFGAGTGAISLLCAARGTFSHIHAVEIQKESAAIAQRNVDLNGLAGKITVHCADVRDFAPEKELDVVFSNPPYMGNGGIESPSQARQIARHEVCGDLSDFCAAASRTLKFGGLFYCVTSCDRTADLFCAMRANGLEPKRMRFVCYDCDHAPSLVLTEAKKGAKAGVIAEKILFLYHNGEMTAEYRKMIGMPTE